MVPEMEGEMQHLLGIAMKNVILGLRVVFRMNFIKIRWKEDPNATHRDYLLHILRELKGQSPLAVVEVGCGLFSTIEIAGILSDESDRFYSFESNLNWFQSISEELGQRSLNCDLRHVENYRRGLEAFLDCDEKKVDVAFIDSAPWESRVEALNLLKPNAKVIVLHDADYFPHHQIFGRESEAIKYPLIRLNLVPYFNQTRLGKRSYDDIFEYWVEIFPKIPSGPTGPPTLVGSDEVDVRKFFQKDGAPTSGIYIFSE